MGAVRLVAVGGQAGAGFGQRGLAGRVTVDFAVGGRVTFARRIGLALCGTPGLARATSTPTAATTTSNQ